MSGRQASSSLPHCRAGSLQSAEPQEAHTTDKEDQLEKTEKQELT